MTPTEATTNRRETRTKQGNQMNNIKKLIVSILSLSVIALFAATEAQAQSVTCQRVGNTIFCSNGTTCIVTGSITQCTGPR